MEKQELIENISRAYDMPIEEVEKAYDVLDKIILLVDDAVKYLWELLRPLSESLSAKMLEPEYANSNYFPITWDSRKPSQVTLNKPRYMVRKIIR